MQIMNNTELLYRIDSILEHLCEGAAYNHYKIDHDKIKEIREIQKHIAKNLGY